MDRIKLGTVRVDDKGNVTVTKEPGVNIPKREESLLVPKVESTDPEAEKDDLEKWRNKKW